MTEPRAETILAVDIGTSSTKALLVDRNGAVITRWRLPHPTHHPEIGAAEQDPDDWWASVRTIALETHDQHRVVVVAVTGQMHGLVARDVDGALVAPSMIWQDQRSAAMLPDLRAALPDGHPKHSGGDLQSGYLAASWHWLSRSTPDIAARVATLALPKDDIVWRLTGRHVTDHSDAVGTGLLDVATGAWDGDMVRAAAIPPCSLPEILPAGSIAGTVSKEASTQSSIPEGVPVVLASGDAAAGAFGAGATRPGSDLLMLSTGCQVLMPLDDVTPIAGGSVWPSAGPGARHLRVVTTSNGGSAIDWAVVMFGMDDPGERRAEAPPWFVPWLDGEREPDVPTGSGAFVGLGVDHGPADLLGAVIDGVTLAIADAAARAERVTAPVAPLIVGGGGTRRRAWVEAVARTFARPLRVVVEPDLSAWGAARIGAAAIGWFETVAEPETWLPPMTWLPAVTDAATAQARLDRWREVATRVAAGDAR